MSGIIYENEFCENSDLYCKCCNSTVWEVESKGNFCLTCNKILDDSETEIQEGLYLPPVAIAYLNDNDEYKYLHDKNGRLIILENQIVGEVNLSHYLEDIYFIEVEYVSAISKEIKEEIKKEYKGVK